MPLQAETRLSPPAQPILKPAELELLLAAGNKPAVYLAFHMSRLVQAATVADLMRVAMEEQVLLAWGGLGGAQHHVWGLRGRSPARMV